MDPQVYKAAMAALKKKYAVGDDEDPEPVYDQGIAIPRKAFNEAMAAGRDPWEGLRPAKRAPPRADAGVEAAGRKIEHSLKAKKPAAPQADEFTLPSHFSPPPFVPLDDEKQRQVDEFIRAQVSGQHSAPSGDFAGTPTPPPKSDADKMREVMEFASAEAKKQAALDSLGAGLARAADIGSGISTDRSGLDATAQRSARAVKTPEQIDAEVRDFVLKELGLKQKSEAATAEQAAKQQQLAQQAEAEKRRVASDTADQEDRDLDRKLRELQMRQMAGDRAADREFRMLMAQLQLRDREQAAKDKMELKHGQTMDREIQALEKRIPSEAAGIAQKLKQLKELVGTEGDIEGIGPLDRLRPDYFTSDKGQDIRQYTRGLVAQQLALQSGKAVSEREVDRKMDELGLGKASPDAMYRRGLDKLEDELGATLRQKTSGFSPEAVKTYHERGGLTADDIGGGPVGMVTVRRKRDGVTRQVPADKAAKYLSDPNFERVQ